MYRHIYVFYWWLERNAPQSAPSSAAHRCATQFSRQLELCNAVFEIHLHKMRIVCWSILMDRWWWWDEKISATRVALMSIDRSIKLVLLRPMRVCFCFDVLFFLHRAMNAQLPVKLVRSISFESFSEGNKRRRVMASSNHLVQPS